jgi:hypothetical protein
MIVNRVFDILEGHLFGDFIGYSALRGKGVGFSGIGGRCAKWLPSTNLARHSKPAYLHYH